MVLYLAATDDSRELDALEREIMLGAAQTAAATCRWLLLIAEFDRLEGYRRWERLSTADWLEWKCQLSIGTAHDHVRVARALGTLPRVRAAFSTGALSYSKVRALARVATPDNEADLLEMARVHTANQLERMVSAYGRVVREMTLTDVERMEQKRRVQRRRDRDDDGWVWTIHLSDEEDALLTKGIDFVRDDGYATARAAAAEAGGDVAELVRMSRVDAFVELVSLGLRNAVAADGTPKENYLVTVHVDAGALGTDERGLVHLGDGTVIHPRTAQRLGCDSMVQLSLDAGRGGGRTTLDLGRSARGFSRNQRRARAFEHPTCEWPGGCFVPAQYTTMHHVQWWTRGGPTDLDNGALLCRRHHKAVHEGGWSLVVGPDLSLRAVHPDGRRVEAPGGSESSVTLPDGVDIGESLRESGVDVKPDYDPWFDPRPNLRYVVDTLINRHYPDVPRHKLN